MARTFLAGALAAGLFWFIYAEFGRTQESASYLFALIMIVLQSLTYFGLIALFQIVKPGQIRGMVANLRKTAG